jgi:hypothetical protein
MVDSKVPQSVLNNVYVKSNPDALASANEVHGYDFNKGIDYEAMFKQYTHMGF